MAFYSPPLQTQLDNGYPTGPRDCAVMGISMACDGGTHGKVVPTPPEIRHVLGDPVDTQGKPRGLYTWEYQVALDALLPAAVERHYYSKSSDVALLKADLAAGFGAILAVDYELVPKAYSGQPTYDGNHALYLQGWRWVANQRQVRDKDPLFDGRCKSWGCAPSGPILVPLRMLLAAAGAFAGAGKFQGATVLRARA